METDEIIMVLGQASKLHAKIEDAIQRVLKYDTEINGENAAPANGDKLSQSEVGVDGAMEARSLSSIRDALEVIEDQLDCLQILQQRQEADREAALSDLEESKRIFLERLRRHQGREREVVQEALAFVGEPALGNDDSNQTFHPTLLPESFSFARSGKEHAKYYEDPDLSLMNDALKLLGWREVAEEETDSALENSQTCRGVAPDVYIENDKTECKGTFFKVLCHGIRRLRKPIGQAVSLAAKSALVVARCCRCHGIDYAGKEQAERKKHSQSAFWFFSQRPFPPPSTGQKKSDNLVNVT